MYSTFHIFRLHKETDSITEHCVSLELSGPRIISFLSEMQSTSSSPICSTDRSSFVMSLSKPRSEHRRLSKIICKIKLFLGQRIIAPHCRLGFPYNFGIWKEKWCCLKDIKWFQFLAEKGYFWTFLFRLMNFPLGPTYVWNHFYQTIGTE